ncbi:MAG TPA: UPF0280 family protein [Alphaproteobacteria bacterium]|nr:UPF0280 family protein [Alphaproteobacteria bacterium]
MSQALPFGAPPLGAILAGGNRRHFQHGPIDLVIEATGVGHEVGRAYKQAWARFETILGELVGELPALRAPFKASGPKLGGPAIEGAVAQRMEAACARHQGVFVTPMAAVAGAVADEVLAALVVGRALEKAYVNNGGDIALYLSPGASFDAGMVSLADTPSAAGTIAIDYASSARGIATSGWRGRSLSLGIADAVTVLAPNAAEADVAATLIANAVDTDYPRIERVPARELDPDSDLGARMATVNVGVLPDAAVIAALDAGADAAKRMIAGGHILAAHLVLQGEVRTIGAAPLKALTDQAEPNIAATRSTGLDKRRRAWPT